MQKSFREYKNLSWALRVTPFQNRTAKTTELMQRTLTMFQPVNVVTDLCNHVKKCNENIKTLKAQVSLLNKIIARRKKSARYKQKIADEFYKKVEQDYLSFVTLEFLAENPDAAKRALTTDEAADLIFKAKKRLKDVKVLAKNIVDFPF